MYTQVVMGPDQGFRHQLTLDIDRGPQATSFSARLEMDTTDLDALEPSESLISKWPLLTEADLLAGVVESFSMENRIGDIIREAGFSGSYEAGHDEDLGRHALRLTFPDVASNLPSNRGIVPVATDRKYLSHREQVEAWAAGMELISTNLEPDVKNRGTNATHDGPRHDAAWQVVTELIPGFGEALSEKSNAVMVNLLNAPLETKGLIHPSGVISAYDLAELNLHNVANEVDVEINTAAATNRLFGYLLDYADGLVLPSTTSYKIAVSLRRIFTHIVESNALHSTEKVRGDTVSNDQLYEWADILTDAAATDRSQRLAA